jgi:hypothetical protein
MDTGVAAVTLNAGMTSRKARPWIKVGSYRIMLFDLMQGFRDNLSVLAFGFARFLVIRKLDY